MPLQHTSKVVSVIGQTAKGYPNPHMSFRVSQQHRRPDKTTYGVYVAGRILRGEADSVREQLTRHGLEEFSQDRRRVGGGTAGSFKFEEDTLHDEEVFRVRVTLPHSSPRGGARISAEEIEKVVGIFREFAGHHPSVADGTITERQVLSAAASLRNSLAGGKVSNIRITPTGIYVGRQTVRNGH